MPFLASSGVKKNLKYFEELKFPFTISGCMGSMLHILHNGILTANVTLMSCYQVTWLIDFWGLTSLNMH